jgi:hypothetical protein
VKFYLFTVWMWIDGLRYVEWAGLWIHWVFTLPA